MQALKWLTSYLKYQVTIPIFSFVLSSYPCFCLHFLSCKLQWVSLTFRKTKTKTTWEVFSRVQPLQAPHRLTLLMGRVCGRKISPLLLPQVLRTQNTSPAHRFHFSAGGDTIFKKGCLLCAVGLPWWAVADGDSLQWCLVLVVALCQAQPQP